MIKQESCTPIWFHNKDGSPRHWQMEIEEEIIVRVEGELLEAHSFLNRF